MSTRTRIYLPRIEWEARRALVPEGELYVDDGVLADGFENFTERGNPVCCLPEKTDGGRPTDVLS